MSTMQYIAALLVARYAVMLLLIYYWFLFNQCIFFQKSLGVRLVPQRSLKKEPFGIVIIVTVT